MVALSVGYAIVSKYYCRCGLTAVAVGGWGGSHSSGAVWESRWPSWPVRPNKPSGFRGRKAILNHASALVIACPKYVNWHLRTLSITVITSPSVVATVLNCPTAGPTAGFQHTHSVSSTLGAGVLSRCQSWVEADWINRAAHLWYWTLLHCDSVAADVAQVLSGPWISSMTKFRRRRRPWPGKAQTSEWFETCGRGA